MKPAIRLGIDIGGTFTDFVVVAPGAFILAKRLSTPADPARAVLAELARLDPDAALPLAHGTTVATNALLERRGARTAFVTTAGFGDLLFLGRGARRDLYSLTPRATPSLVPEELCFEVRQRTGPDGRALIPLRQEELQAVAAQVARAQAESAAVCLLFAFLAPGHERRVGRALAAEPAGPGHVSLSVDVLPEHREFERASTVAVNAYVAPLMSRYLDDLAAATAPRPLTVMGSHAGTLLPREAARLPVATILSGPAAGVLGALAVARRAGFERILCFDMGGTSTDVALAEDGVPFAPATMVGGLPVQRAAVDIHTVGAGGGSIVRADTAGALRVGPGSAGADPGPAAYGRGGRLPTVTDAHVVLGRLRAEAPLAGGLRLDPDRARAAFAAVAAALGISVEQAALGALAVADAVMARALRRVSIERGVSPGELTLVAFGGAGPLHGCTLAEAVGVRRVLVPSLPGALAALGLATAAPVATASRSVIRPRGQPPPEPEGVFRALERQARRALGPAAGRVGIERSADVRYVGQSWDLSVPWPFSGDVRRPFEAAHARRFGYARPEEPIEVVTLRVRAAGLPAIDLPPPPPLEPDRPGRTRLVTDAGEPMEAPVRLRASLAPGEAVAGPAILTEPDSTIYVAPRWLARVGPWGDLILTREENQPPHR